MRSPDRYKFLIDQTFPILCLGALSLVGAFAGLRPAEIWPISFVAMMIHELGHAIFGLLGGHFALPFFFVSFILERSLILELVVCVSLLAGSYFLFIFGHMLPSCIALATCLFSTLLLFTTTATTEMISTMGGLLAELIASSLIMLLYYYPLARPQNWKILRYPVVLVAAMVFHQNLEAWVQALWDPTKIPYPRDESNQVNVGAVFQLDAVISGAPVGDLDKLIRTNGWSESGLVHCFLLVGAICLLTLLAKTVYALLSHEKAS